MSRTAPSLSVSQPSLPEKPTPEKLAVTLPSVQLPGFASALLRPEGSKCSARASVTGSISTEEAVTVRVFSALTVPQRIFSFTVPAGMFWITQSWAVRGTVRVFLLCSVPSTVTVSSTAAVSPAGS